MMKNETCPTDAGKLRSGTPRQQRHVQWSLTLLAGLVLVAISGPVVWAKVSDTTGPINGSAPTATGTLSVMFPGGTTAVTNNATVGTAMKPADFRVSASSLVLQDADGDTGLSSSVDTAAVTWVWKNGTVALSAAQLAAPFSTNFLGKTLTVSASVPVTVSSLTGAPTTGGSSTVSSATYSLVVPTTAPVVWVNGVSSPMSTYKPTSGFVGAHFQIMMNGIDTTDNDKFSYSVNPAATWINVDATTGFVKFVGTPINNSPISLVAVDIRTGQPAATTTIAITKWYTNGGTTTIGYSGSATAACTAISANSHPVGNISESIGQPSNQGTTYNRALNSSWVWAAYGDLSIYPDSGFIYNPSINYYLQNQSGSDNYSAWFIYVRTSIIGGYSSNTFYRNMYLMCVNDIGS